MRTVPVGLRRVLAGLGLALSMLGAAAGADDNYTWHRELMPVRKALDAMREDYYRNGNLQIWYEPLDRQHDKLLAALRREERRHDPQGQAQALLLLARLERMQSTRRPEEMQAAEANTQRRYVAALQAARDAGDVWLQIQALNGYVQSLVQERNLTSALDPAEQLGELADRNGSTKDRLEALELRAELEMARGQPAACADFLRQAEELVDDAHDTYDAYRLYGLRAELEIERGARCSYQPDYESCQKAWELVVEDSEHQVRIAQSAGYATLVAPAAQRRDIYRALGPTMAEQVERSHRLRDMARDTYFLKPQMVQALTHRQFAPAPNPAMAQGLRQFEASLHSAGAVNRYDPLAWSVQASIDELQGDEDGALAGYRRAAELLDHDRRTLADDEGSGTALAKLVDIYYHLALQLLDRHQEAAAFELLERSRARSLTHLLQQRQVDLGEAQRQSLYAHWLDLRARIGKEQAKIYDRSLGQRTETDETQRIAARIDALEADSRALSGQLAADPRLQSLVDAPVASLAALQSAAGRGGYEVLYYLFADNALIVWLIAPDAVHVVKVHYPGPFDQRVQQVLDSAADPNRGFEAQAAQELFMFAVYPVLPWVHARHLVVVPHDALDALPFALLQDPADGSFLGDRFELSTVPSASVLLALAGAPDVRGGRLLAAATPSLEAAVAEVRGVGALYSGRARVIDDHLLTRDELFAAGPGFNLLHLSVHGVFDVKEPLLSYLELAPAGSQGHVSAAQLFALQLPPGSLVVLSACESGRAQGGRTNEALGMVRAMLYAGASALVLSSWKVDAQATELWMETFYREAQGLGLAAAAQRASAAVRQRPQFQHPYYWAPFQVTGS